jgi:hypothetical protein
LNQLRDINENWYERYAYGNQPLLTMMTDIEVSCIPETFKVFRGCAGVISYWYKPDDNLPTIIKIILP